MVDIEIIGNPISLKRHRHSRWGTYDPSKEDKKIFAEKVVKKFTQDRPKYKFLSFPIQGPIIVHINFHIKRPKSHYRTGKYEGIVKDKAPIAHTSKPDIDNLAKFVLDACNNVLWKDDSIIVDLHLVKHYSDKPKTEINILYV